MSIIAIDIETAPLPAEDQEQFAPEFTSALKPPPADCPPAKVGNLKDPAKIAAKEREHELRWQQDTIDQMNKIDADIEAQRAAWLEKAQLDAMRCRVCAVGVLDEYGESFLYGIGSTESEADLLECTWNWIIEADKATGHNIKGYDLPMLEQRSAILGVEIPPGIRDRNRRFYNGDKFIDTLELWPKKLDMIGRALGIGGKPGDMSGKDFWRADEATQREYLTWDLRACAEILKRMGGAA